jgi:thioredoxin 1
VKDVASTLHGKVKVIKVDVDKNQQAAASYGIRSIPTLILFFKGRIIWKKAGLMRRKDLLAALESSLKNLSGN